MELDENQENTFSIKNLFDFLEKVNSAMVVKIEVKDIESLARMIEKLIMDEKLRNSMGYNGRKLAEQEFDINKVVEKHFEIYEGGV